MCLVSVWRTHGQVCGSFLFDDEAIFPQLLLTLTVARLYVLPLSQGRSCRTAQTDAKSAGRTKKTWITFSETKIDTGVDSRTGINLEEREFTVDSLGILCTCCARGNQKNPVRFF